MRHDYRNMGGAEEVAQGLLRRNTLTAEEVWDLASATPIDKEV